MSEQNTSVDSSTLAGGHELPGSESLTTASTSAPYAYEIEYEGGSQELVYAQWLDKYASDKVRACPCVPLYLATPAPVHEALRQAREALRLAENYLRPRVADTGGEGETNALPVIRAAIKKATGAAQ